MLNGLVYIIDDTMTVYMERFHNANSIRNCEHLMWILLYILQILKIRIQRLDIPYTYLYLYKDDSLRQGGAM
jgi:hypothetical protein